MNIIDYIEKFSDKTFKEMPFNDVDALVLSTLSYPSFENLISDAFQDEQIPYKIKFLSKEDCNKLGKENTTLDHSKLLKVLAKSKRFKELEIVEDSTNFSKQEVTQFYAMSIILDSNTMFISFRGTDTRMAGWKEDCNMSFLDEVPSQRLALDYFTYLAKKYKNFNFYIGGHSKGGNLSFYVGLHIEKHMFKRIKKLYSFDGPGFYREDILNNKNYDLLKDKMVKIVPQDSIVGMLLYDTPQIKIVDSKYSGVVQHNPYLWKINDKGEFLFLEKRNKSSYINQMAMSLWLKSMNKEETILMVEALFSLSNDLDQSIKEMIINLPLNLFALFKKYKSSGSIQIEKIYNISKRLLYYYKKATDFYSKDVGKKLIENN